MPTFTLRVFRGDPTRGAFKDYRVEAEEGMVVLDVIHRLQATQATDLAVRWNCKAGKCGSCSAEIDGQPRLMCMTRMDLFAEGEPITVAPIRAFPLIRDLVTDERERTDRRHGDRLTLGEEVHAGHAHEPRLAVDLGAARPALARLAVPPHGEVRRLRRLEAVDHVQHHHPLLGLHAIVLELAPRRVAPEDAQREGRHHFLSWKSALSSAGISGRGSRESWSAPSRSRNTTLTLPH